MKATKLTILLSAAFCFSTAAAGADWPQWHGANRDGKSLETGLLKEWPEGGPRLLWVANVNVGAGYSSVSVAGETIYTTGLVGKEGFLYALDLEGKLKWKLNYGPEWSGQHSGTRTTPAVDGDRLYLMSAHGRIVCVNTETGKVKWGFDALRKFGGKNIKWGIAESPLVYDDKVICTPGGRDATVVALNKMTGRTIWTSRGLSDLAGYCSPLLIKDAQKNLIVTVTANHIVGIGAEDGSVFWRVPYRNKWAAHPNTPLYQDGRIFVTSGYGLGGVMLKLSANGTSVKRLWTEKSIDTHHGGVVLHDGYIYGTSLSGQRICLDWKSGQVKHRTAKTYKGSVIAADGMLYCYDERGTVSLVEAAPDGYNIVSSFKVTRGKGNHWAHPAIANGRLYVRHGGALMAYDIRGKHWKDAAEPAETKGDAPSKPAHPGRKELDEQRADTKLKLAKSYLLAGMRDKAKEMFQSVVEDYPGTRAAEKAKQELENLR